MCVFFDPFRISFYVLGHPQHSKYVQITLCERLDHRNWGKDIEPEQHPPHEFLQVQLGSPWLRGNMSLKMPKQSMAMLIILKWQNDDDDDDDDDDGDDTLVD
jgi:hypothetical protein